MRYGRSDCETNARPPSRPAWRRRVVVEMGEGSGCSEHAEQPAHAEDDRAPVRGGGCVQSRRRRRARSARPRRPRGRRGPRPRRAAGASAEHVGGDDVGVGRVGPPDADAHALEVGRAELALAATSARCGRPGRRRAATRMSPNGRSISSWTTSTRSRSSLRRRARGRRSGPPRSCRSAAAASRRAGRRGRCGPRSAHRRTSSWASAAPSGRAARRRPEADVVRRVGVAGPGVAEPDDQPVDRGGAEDASGLVVRGLVAASPRPRRRRPPRPRRPRAARRPRRRARSRSRSRPRPARASAG